MDKRMISIYFLYAANLSFYSENYFTNNFYLIRHSGRFHTYPGTISIIQCGSQTSCKLIGSGM